MQSTLRKSKLCELCGFVGYYFVINWRFGTAVRNYERKKVFLFLLSPILFFICFYFFPLRMPAQMSILQMDESVLRLTGHLQSFAQQDSLDYLKSISDSILKEGMEIYECNMSSKTSSEFLIEKLSMEEIFGLITYKKNNIIHTIFLKGDTKNPIVRYTFSYPVPFNAENVNLDGEPRPLSEYEISFNKMRNKILKLALKRKSFFTNYAEIVLNPVFIQRENLTYVFLTSSSHDNSFIPLGNDYLLVFNEKSKLLTKEKIHQNLIEVPVSGGDTLQPDQGLASFHIHSELSSPFISSTDISTLLMQKETVNWESHIVVSSEYVSFFFPVQKILEIITKEEYEKMSEEELKE